MNITTDLRKKAADIVSSEAAIAYKMCFSTPPMQCLRNRGCVFYDGKECHITDNFHKQKSVQQVNTGYGTKRVFSFAEMIKNG